jgi:hypothetical protein
MRLRGPVAFLGLATLVVAVALHIARLSGPAEIAGDMAFGLLLVAALLPRRWDRPRRKIAGHK